MAGRLRHWNSEGEPVVNLERLPNADHLGRAKEISKAFGAKGQLGMYFE